MYVCPECGTPHEAAGSCASDGAALVFTTDALSGTTIGPYRVATVIGAGGTGQVYRAVHPEIGSRVAIKVLAKEFVHDPESLERFFAEARAVNLIRHENIVNILDFERLPDGRPYIVMELIEGRPLSRWARSFDHVPLVSLFCVAGDVLAALEATHEKGIVHRDLKPHNILVTPEGRGKVLDFGVAKLKPETSGGSGPTESGALVGTPAYMAPEQALERTVDARTDVYAMGVVLFECATGKRPFVADSLMELLRKQAYEAPPRPRSLRPDIPAAYERVILRALAKSPDDRWPSARAMRTALEQAGESSDSATPPTVKGKRLAAARPEAPPVATQRTPPRRTWLLVAVAAAAVAGGALVVTLSRSPAPSSPPLAATQRAAPPDAASPAAKGGMAKARVPAWPDATPPVADARPAAKKPAGHSVTGYLKRAHARARQRFGDAQLVGIRAVGVGKNGRVNFSADPSYRVMYSFASMSRAKPAMAALDPRARSQCVVRVTARKSGVGTAVATDSCGRLAVLQAPACTARDVWRKAFAELGLAKTDVATLRYRRTLGAAAPFWQVSGGGSSAIVKDACE